MPKIVHHTSVTAYIKQIACYKNNPFFFPSVTFLIYELELQACSICKTALEKCILNTNQGQA